MTHKHATACPHHHHDDVDEESVKYLFLSFLVNILLSVVEFAGGIIAGSVALIGDALHNTSDAFSILIAVIAFKIGRKKATNKYTYGFKRAELVGGFANLILLFAAGVYLAIEGIERLIYPNPIAGWLIIFVSLLALLVDAFTAKISHHHAHSSANMKMVFLHNLADAFGSIGVIISGVCVVLFDVYFVDGVIALIIAGYMIFQAFVSFKPIVNVLMNAAPENLDFDEIVKAIENVEGVDDVHHIHLWCVNEHDVALECHIQGTNLNIVEDVSKMLNDKFHIAHCNIQLENKNCRHKCDL